MSETTIKLKDWIRAIPDFPKPGILFRDITTLLMNPDAFRHSISLMVEPYLSNKPTCIAGIESRGFIFGAAMADRLGVPFVLIRKPGKLPYKTRKISYQLEYGEDTIEIHEDAIEAGDKVLLVDDLLATGGTMAAATKLIKELGGDIIEVLFLIELEGLAGRSKLDDLNIRALLKY
jgi:adenine phosphoribosyltransferase